MRYGFSDLFGWFTKRWRLGFRMPLVDVPRGGFLTEAGMVHVRTVTAGMVVVRTAEATVCVA